MKNINDHILFCFCGPSGSGKSTVCGELLNIVSNLKLSISTTTRSPRGDEKDGDDYFFVSPDEFKKRIDENRFIEFAEFNKNLYGTELTNIEIAKKEDKDLLLDIDVQGVIQLKKLYPANLVTIFIFPPSFEILKQRFISRGTEDHEIISARLEIAKSEIATLTTNDFSDYLLINDSLSETIDYAKGIILSERNKFRRIKREIKDSIFKLG